MATQKKLDQFEELREIILHLDKVGKKIAREKASELYNRDDVIGFYSKALSSMDEDIIRRLKYEIEFAKMPINIKTVDDIVNLARWIKKYYLRWLPEVPICKVCHVTMTLGVYRSYTSYGFKKDDKSWTGYRRVPSTRQETCRKIERYQCENCHRVQVESRENDVLAILYNRKGRCGEYSIFFVAVCYAIGIRVRLVLDVIDDHVWVEVFMDEKWYPIDPSSDEPNRLIKNRFLFQEWGWSLIEVLALESSKKIVNVVDDYR